MAKPNLFRSSAEKKVDAMYGSSESKKAPATLTEGAAKGLSGSSDANAEAKKAAGMKKGGGVKRYAKGGGIEVRGKTRGKMC